MNRFFNLPEDKFKRACIRFCKDYNVPVNVFDEYHIKTILHMHPELEKPFMAMEEEIFDQFNGNVDAWIESYGHLRDTIISSLEESEAYKAFNAKNIHDWDIEKSVGERSIYNKECSGKKYFSIDLRKANFQALKFAGVIPSEFETYEDFIGSYGGSEYIKGSKYLRQVIFGKLNPSRTIKVEQYMMKKVLDYINENQLIWAITENDTNVPAELISFNSDELVFSLNAHLGYGYVMEIEEWIKKSLGIDVKAELVKIEWLPITNSNGNCVDAYIRENVNTGEKKLKKASTTFYFQIWKLWQGEDITKDDLKFFFEDQYAHFDEPLKIVGNE